MPLSEAAVLSHRPWIVAHRGGSRLGPENVKTTFDTAMTMNVDGLECDVQLTADEVPVIFHDRSLNKLGLRGKRVRDFNYRDLRSCVEHLHRGQPYSGKTVLSLESFLKHYGHKTRLFIELKSRWFDRDDRRQHLLFDKVTFACLEAQLPPQQLYMMSFDTQLMFRGHEEFPQWSWIPLFERSSELSELSRISPFQTVGLWVGDLNEPTVAQIHKKGWRLLVYTCNGPRQWKLCQRYRADIVMSDRPDWLLDKRDLSS